jgi:hypothetical protein
MHTKQQIDFIDNSKYIPLYRVTFGAQNFLMKNVKIAYEICTLFNISTNLAN